MNNREFFNSEASNQRDLWLYADSTVESRASELRKSAPYIVQVVNSGGATISNVDIGDSYANRTVSNFGQSDFIAITSTVQNISYANVLANSENEPFIVGATMVISSVAGQLDTPMVVTHRNANGERKDFTISPTPDPYQSQTDRVVDFTEYIFDGFTRLRLSRVLSGTMAVRFYLKNKFSATQEVAGRESLISYGSPGIIKEVMF